MTETYHWLGEEGDEPSFAVNEAAVYFNESELTVAYGDGQIVAITIENDNERKLIRTVLGDVNLWLAFLGGLSQAVEKLKEEQVIGG